MSDSNDSAGPTPGAQVQPAPSDAPKSAQFRTDFEEKYPVDFVAGEELADRARVWRVYRGEAIQHDDAMLKTWNDTVNILLTFAGLFSAAVTSFVVSSADDLKPDPNAYMANVLFAILNSTSTDSSAVSRLSDVPPLTAAPTRVSRVVNGLWFVSLFLSLAVALLCILVKQWLDEFLGRTRGSAKHPRQWAQRRTFYFQGLDRWNVSAIISFLPLILHIALFSFLAGLVLFLWELDSIIRWVLLGLVIALATFYVVCFMLPLWSPACPYATPLLDKLLVVLYALSIGLKAIQILVSLCTQCFRRPNWRPPRLHGDLPVWLPLFHLTADRDSSVSDLKALGQSIAIRARALHDKNLRRPFDRIIEWERISISSGESEDAQKSVLTYQLDCDALLWFFHYVSDSDALAVAWQSLGALLKEPLSPRTELIRATIPSSYLPAPVDMWAVMRCEGRVDDAQLGRIARSILWASNAIASRLQWVPLLHNLPDSDSTALSTTRSPDAALIHAHEHTPVEYVRSHLPEWVKAHPHVVWTAAGLVQRCANPDWMVGLLMCLPSERLKELGDSAWSHIGHSLAWSSDRRRVICDHPLGDECNLACAANGLARRIVLLDKESRGVGIDNSGDSGLSTLFDQWSYVQLLVHIMALPRFKEGHFLTTPAVAIALTVEANWSRIDPNDLESWASALECTPCHDYFIADATDGTATRYLTTWRGLVCGPAKTHKDIDRIDSIPRLFPTDPTVAGSALIIRHLMPRPDTDDSQWRRICTTTLALRDSSSWATALLSLLSLLDSCAIASLVWPPLNVLGNSRRRTELSSRDFWLFDCCRLLDFSPVGLDLTQDERLQWTKLVIRTTRHCIAVCPSVWADLQRDVAESTRDGERAFFAEVEAVLREYGPCKEGSCGSVENTDWPLDPLP